MDLQVAGIELERALRAFSTSELPLERLPLAGSVAGTLTVNWQGSPLNARMAGDLRVQPVYRAGQLPVEAAVQAAVDFQASRCRCVAWKLPARASHLSAQGRLSANSDLSLSLTTRSLAELAPMVTSWRGSRAQDLPIEFAGRAAFRGSVQGGWSRRRWPA